MNYFSVHGVSCHRPPAPMLCLWYVVLEDAVHVLNTKQNVCCGFEFDKSHMFT